MIAPFRHCCILLMLCAGFVKARTDTTVAPYAVVSGYANDDLFAEHSLNDLFGSRLFPAEDDRVSTTFFISLAVPSMDGILATQLSYYITTDRQGLRRMDLALIRSMLELTTDHARVSGGMGLFYAGDLGGVSVQNRYHRTFGYEEVKLPYSGRKNLGGMMAMRAELLAAERGGDEFLPFLDVLLVTGSLLPGHGDIGASYRWRSGRFQAEVTAGYRGRYGVPPDLNQVAGSSFYTGLLGALPMFGTMQCTVWYTRGQYGIPHAVQFGIGVGWNTDAVRPVRLNDIMGW